MLHNYLIIAWRNLWKNKVFSLINIFGLSVGIAFTLLIGAYVWGELQVNRQLKNADNQYIILSKWKDPNMGNEIESIAELPKVLKQNYPNLVANYYHADLIKTAVSAGQKNFREDVQIGDSTLLTIYGFKLMEGNPQTVLNEPYTVVASKKMALKCFGRTNIIGKTLNFENFDGKKHDFTITGVMGETSKNSVTSLVGDNEFFFNAFAAQYFKRNLDGWTNWTIDYIELQKGIDPKTVEKAIQHVMLKQNPDKTIREQLTPYLVKLKDYNLIAHNGLIKKMTSTLSCIALFILFMAVINFVNICIGRSSGRMKEMGIRKVLGSLRKQLIWQFLIESILLVMLSTIVALVIYIVARPYFSDMLGKDIIGLFSFPVYFIPVPFVFAALVGVLAGIYPALVLSALKSVDSLKGKLNSVKESVLFRKTLVAFQFMVAAIVFIGAVIIAQQVNLFFKGNLGYNKDYMAYTPLPRDWSAKGVQKMESIREQLAQMPQVRNIALSYEIPDSHNGGNYLVFRRGFNDSKPISSTGLVADNQFAATYNIPLIAGTFFKPVYSSGDSSQVVINETEAKLLGWKNPADAVGQTIMLPAYNWKVGYTVCGVMADFHFESMQNKIGPITFMNVNYATNYRYFSIRLKPGNMQQNLAALQSKWAKLMPGAPFEYNFMDDALKKLYATELQLKKAAYTATLLSVIIVLLGVLGLVSLSIQKRTREIGIRKVLGASVKGIIMLFMKDFLVTVIIAGVVACPLGYLIMQHWLNDYAYRINITPLPFAITMIILVILTAILIVMQTIRTASANPVKSLRAD